MYIYIQKGIYIYIHTYIGTKLWTTDCIGLCTYVLRAYACTCMCIICIYIYVFMYIYIYMYFVSYVPLWMCMYGVFFQTSTSFLMTFCLPRTGPETAAQIQAGAKVSSSWAMISHYCCIHHYKYYNHPLLYIYTVLYIYMYITIAYYSYRVWSIHPGVRSTSFSRVTKGCPASWQRRDVSSATDIHPGWRILCRVRAMICLWNVWRLQHLEPEPYG